LCKTSELNDRDFIIRNVYKYCCVVGFGDCSSNQVGLINIAVKYVDYTLCLKKRHPFYFCDIFVKFHPILLIFGRNMSQEI